MCVCSNFGDLQNYIKTHTNGHVVFEMDTSSRPLSLYAYTV